MPCGNYVEIFKYKKCTFSFLSKFILIKHILTLKADRCLNLQSIFNQTWGQ